MNLTLEQARAALVIDQDLLEHEVAEHPVKQEQVFQAYLAALETRDAAKLQCDKTIAMQSETLRASQDKVTESRLALLLQSDPICCDERAALHRATMETEAWRGMLDAYRSRGSALRDLTTLANFSGRAPNTVSEYTSNRASLAEAREHKSAHAPALRRRTTS